MKKLGIIFIMSLAFALCSCVATIRPDGYNRHYYREYPTYRYHYGDYGYPYGGGYYRYRR
jgi:hypothetical protein